MIRSVRAPEVCGTFNAQAAVEIAHELLPADRMYSWFGVSKPANVTAVTLGLWDSERRDAFQERLELSFYDGRAIPRDSILYVNNAADPRQRLGPNWHVDIDRWVLGSSTFPTQFVEGEIDLTAIANQYDPSIRDDITTTICLSQNAVLLSGCVERSLEKGDLKIVDEIEPGQLVTGGSETIHRSYMPTDPAQPRNLPRMLYRGVL